MLGLHSIITSDVVASRVTLSWAVAMHARMRLGGGWKWCAVASLVLLATLPSLRAWAANYQGVDPYEEYGKRINAAEQVAPLSDSLFGDRINLYNGTTTFAATDVSLPGNNALPVSVSRELPIEDKRAVPADGGELPGFADWNLDVPYILATVTAQDGWTLRSTGATGATNRCSDNVDNIDTLLPMPSGGMGYAPYGQVWNGDHLHVPGAGDQILLANTQPKSPAYASASTYKWVTTGHWKVSCLASVTGRRARALWRCRLTGSPTPSTMPFQCRCRQSRGSTPPSLGRRLSRGSRSTCSRPACRIASAITSITRTTVPS